MTRKTDFEGKLESLINEYSQENSSNTPDYILARFMLNTLTYFNIAVNDRENWYGRSHHKPDLDTVTTREETP